MWCLPLTSGSAMHVWASRARVDVPRVPYGRRPGMCFVNTELIPRAARASPLPPGMKPAFSEVLY